MKAIFNVICCNKNKDYILKKEEVTILQKFGCEENTYYTIMFNNGVKLDFVKKDNLEFFEEKENE